MRLFEDFCEALTRALGLSAISSWGEQTSHQRPLVSGEPHTSAHRHGIAAETPAEPVSANGLPKGPRFQPPNASPGFVCDYSAMKGWRHTASAGSRTSWLEKPISAGDPTGGIYDILTDYDEYWPTGIVRKVRKSS